jgi:poly(A) polymerase
MKERGDEHIGGRGPRVIELTNQQNPFQEDVKKEESYADTPISSVQPTEKLVPVMMEGSPIRTDHCFGTTPPISMHPPTREELMRHDDLINYLTERDDVFETRAGHDKRAQIIHKISGMLLAWGREVLAEKNAPAHVVANGGGIQVRLFGSTRLGVNAPDADIDCLCIAPFGITREDFFASFGALLERRVDVEGVYPVPEAYTPVIKFSMDDQPVDMIFVALTTCPIPDTFNILDMKYITGLEEQDIRSLNGSRVAEKIFAAVPNIPNFCFALRTIKHWARRRGIYSNILGFLSGCSCAIMVAFVCQRFPNACGATLVENFFLLFSHWVWSPGMPVLLGEIETRESPQSLEEMLAFTRSKASSKYIRVWNPKLTPSDGHQLMPIITPAYPAMNAAYNVGAPQFRRIQVGPPSAPLYCFDNGHIAGRNSASPDHNSDGIFASCHYGSNRSRTDKLERNMRVLCGRVF